MDDELEHGDEPEHGEAPEGSVTHDPVTPDALVAFMTGDWAAPAPQATGLARFAPFTVGRRTALSARFPGEWLVVPTGGPKVRANDTDHPFRPGSDHYWLTGSFEPNGVLVLAPTSHGHDATLFVAPRMDRATKAFFTDRRHGELWVGPPGPGGRGPARRGLRPPRRAGGGAEAGRGGASPGAARPRHHGRRRPPPGRGRACRR
ncbi:MAG TPA: aminopeptidase P N-terminal domain-containing protein [Acidimicrobiales bacterium]|nr:aminopeptidase P N-terminal domain-containing protein [Acidimicrobiales bacterium]